MKRTLLLKILFYIILFTSITQVQAQLTHQWSFNPLASANAGADQVNNMKVDAQGNVYTAGLFSGTVDFDPSAATVNLVSKGLSDAFVAKYDASGALVWARSIGGTGADRCWSINFDVEGNVYGVGQFTGIANFNTSGTAVNLTVNGTSTDAFISKFNSSGTLQWAKRMGGKDVADLTYSIVSDANKNVYAVGSFNGTTVDFDGTNGTATAGGNDIFITKFNETGVLQWVRSIGGTAGETANSVAIDGNNDIYVTGVVGSTTNVNFNPGGTSINLSSSGGTDFFIAKYNSAGICQWAKSMGGVNSDKTDAITVDVDKNIYVSGSFSGTADFDSSAGVVNMTSKGGSDIFVAKFDANGNYIWVRGMGGSIDDYSGNSISVDNYKNVFIAGQFVGTTTVPAKFYSPAGDGIETLVSIGGSGYDGLLTQYNSNGDLKWAKNFGSAAGDNCASTGRDDNDNIYIAGTFTGTANFNLNAGTNNLTATSGSDIFIAKYQVDQAVLPITLTGFRAKKDSYYVKLEWSTLSEQNNNRFELLKSNDGKNWQVATTIVGSNNSSQRIDYSWLDESPFNGTTYYQLKQIDDNGTFTLSEPVSIYIGLTEKNSLKWAYVDNVMKLYTSSNNNIRADLSLYNTNGQKVVSQQLQMEAGANQFDIPLQLNKGVYVVKLQEGSIAKTAKILIQ